MSERRPGFSAGVRGPVTPVRAIPFRGLLLAQLGRFSEAVNVLSHLFHIWPNRSGARRLLDRLQTATPVPHAL